MCGIKVISKRNFPVFPVEIEERKNDRKSSVELCFSICEDQILLIPHFSFTLNFITKLKAFFVAIVGDIKAKPTTRVIRE